MMRAEIRRRVERAGGSNATVPPGGNCYICGHLFNSDYCPHGVQDQQMAVDQFRREELGLV